MSALLNKPLCFPGRFCTAGLLGLGRNWLSGSTPMQAHVKPKKRRLFSLYPLEDPSEDMAASTALEAHFSEHTDGQKPDRRIASFDIGVRNFAVAVIDTYGPTYRIVHWEPSFSIGPTQKEAKKKVLQAAEAKRVKKAALKQAKLAGVIPDMLVEFSTEEGAGGSEVGLKEEQVIGLIRELSSRRDVLQGVTHVVLESQPLYGGYIYLESAVMAYFLTLDMSLKKSPEISNIESDGLVSLHRQGSAKRHYCHYWISHAIDTLNSANVWQWGGFSPTDPHISSLRQNPKTSSELKNYSMIDAMFALRLQPERKWREMFMQFPEPEHSADALLHGLHFAFGKGAKVEHVAREKSIKKARRLSGGRKRKVEVNPDSE